MKNGRMQAKDLSDEVILDAVRKSQAKKQLAGGYWAEIPADEVWASLWDIQETLPEVPNKVILAKLDSLVRRKVLDGCTCGCRGDFCFPK